MTWRAGVDVLCFGGIKNGLAVGDAVVFFDKALAEDFGYRCKQAGQLASKMRFMAAPWAGLLESGAWLRNARHANAYALRLAAKAEGVPGVQLTFPVEANSVFLHAGPAVFEALAQRGWRFYTFIGGAARFVFAWDADLRRVDALADDISACAANAMMCPPGLPGPRPSVDHVEKSWLRTRTTSATSRFE
jgi:threonine aldolase